MTGRRALLASAIVTLLIGLVVSAAYPPPGGAGELPSGFVTPIMAFEFVETPAEVTALLGPDESVRVAMHRGHLGDYAFLIAYGLFGALAALGTWSERTKTAWAHAALFPLASMADAFENLQLIALTSVPEGEMAEPLARLALYTWTKWGLLALGGALIGARLLRAGATREKLVGALSFGPLAFALLSPLARGIAHELMGLTLLTAFAGWPWVIGRVPAERTAS